MEAQPVITVGIYQPAALVETPVERLGRLTRLFDDPAARACDVMVLPELFLSGYFAGDKLRELAEPSSGPFATQACRIAARHDCAIVCGYPERAGDDLYNAALCAWPDGRVAASHRKNLLPFDYEERYFRQGKEPTIIELKGWKIGVLICYESEFPEPVRYYAQAGCDLVVAPTALTDDWSVVAQRVIPARAFVNNIFVAYANHAGADQGHRFLGESVIASPFGRDLARAGDGEALITARLEQAEIVRARERLHFLQDVGQSCYR